MLGLEPIAGAAPPAGLVAAAGGWLAAGIVSPSLELLAASVDSSADEALRLLRAAAVELDVAFAGTQAARTYSIQASLHDLTSVEGVAGISDYSNGMTDALEARLRRLFRRRRSS